MIIRRIEKPLNIILKNTNACSYQHVKLFPQTDSLTMQCISIEEQQCDPQIPTGMILIFKSSQTVAASLSVAH